MTGLLGFHYNWPGMSFERACYFTARLDHSPKLVGFFLLASGTSDNSKEATSRWPMHHTTFSGAWRLAWLTLSSPLPFVQRALG